MPRIDTSSANVPARGDSQESTRAVRTGPDTSPVHEGAAPPQLQNLPVRGAGATASTSGSGARFTQTPDGAHPTRDTSPVREVAVDARQLREVDRMDDDAEAVVDDLLIDIQDDRSSTTGSFATAREGSPDGRGSAFVTAPNTPQQGSPAQSVRDGEQSPRSSVHSERSSRRPPESPQRTPSPASEHPSEIREESPPHSPSVASSIASSESWHPGTLGNRQVNDVNHLERTLPDNLGQCVTTLLTPLRSQFSDAEFQGLVQRQTAALQEHGVNSKGDLISVLRTVSRKDNMMRLAQGTVGGLHFNLPGIATSYGPEPKELVVGSTAGTNVLQGMAGGVIAGLSDATSTPAKAKTFHDAYYKRPAADQLPEQLNGFNAQSGRQAIGETNASWVGAFGASYVARGTARTVATLTHGPEAGAAVDTAMATPANVIAGIGATFIQHKIDERQGRTGVPFFVARNNLGECIEASRKPLHGYVGSAIVGAGKHAGNTVTQFPAGVKEAVTSPALVASTASLAAGLTVPFTAAGEVQKKLSNHPKLGDLLGAATKYATLEGAWAGWSTAYAGAAHLHAQRARRLPAGSAVPTTGDVEEAG